MTTTPGEPTLPGTIADGRALFGGRPAEESLVHATARLERVITSIPHIEPWLADVRTAIQACALAVEYHMVGLGSHGGTRDQIQRNEPRLLDQLERLDAELSRVLIDSWKAKEAVLRPHTQLVRPLEELAASLRSLTEREFNLEHESQMATGGEE
jgi:hypothetical protein